ncbi:hypothetical protein [Limnobacter parvus]|uniref:Penicillin-binding protein activator LpoB n=1 Tax=Limnobacter parvus TaxID=2939690 RepID=A0ABT1XFP3_9BURK|nr:hypothetical protein [Limnobacter parvus]MCR2745689.1 hypothetical protein [Limnobacter parvus]
MSNIHQRLVRLLRFTLLGIASLAGTTALAEVRIAVTDLSYEESVAHYFSETSYSFKGKSDFRDSSSARDTNTTSRESSNTSLSSSVDMAYSNKQGYRLIIQRGELRKFTGDIKGGLIKNGYRVVQGKPWTSTNTETLYDIIARIKKGFYPNTDYVLFGTVTAIDFRNDNNKIQGSNATNYSTNLELVAEFSLINVKTYEVKAGFSAIGEGSESKLLTGDGVTNFSPSIPRIMKQVSENLGADVSGQVYSQFSEGARPVIRGSNVDIQQNISVEEKVITYR